MGRKDKQRVTESTRPPKLTVNIDYIYLISWGHYMKQTIIYGKCIYYMQVKKRPTSFMVIARASHEGAPNVKEETPWNKLDSSARI